MRGLPQQEVGLNCDIMSELGKLAGKSLKVEIGKVSLELVPLKFKEREVIAGLFSSSNPREQMEAMMEFIKKVLKNSYPDATDEELDDVSFEHFTELSKAVMKVHGLEVPEEDLKKLVPEAIKKNK